MTQFQVLYKGKKKIIFQEIDEWSHKKGYSTK